MVIGLLGCTLALTAAACSGDDDDGDSDGATTTSLPEDFSMVGTWTGHRERIASDEGYRNGDATLTVTDENGTTFEGTMGWTTPEGDESDPLVGAFSPDGSLMAGADDEGVYTFRLIDATTLDYCYAEHGEGFRTTCARLEKQE